MTTANDLGWVTYASVDDYMAAAPSWAKLIVINAVGLATIENKSRVEIGLREEDYTIGLDLGIAWLHHGHSLVWKDADGLTHHTVPVSVTSVCRDQDTGNPIGICLDVIPDVWGKI